MRRPALRAAIERRRVKPPPAAVDPQASGDEFEWVGTPRATAAPSRPPVRRRASRRRGLLRLALACAAIAAVVVVVIVVAAGGGSPRAPAPTPVSLAEQTSAASPGYRFTLTIEASAAGRTLETSAAGTIDQRHAGDGEMQVSVDGHSFRELFLGPYLYLEVSAASTPWVKVDLAAYERALGVTSIGGDDPAQTLTLLRAAAKVRLVGRATVAGVATMHYHALVDLDRYAAVLAPALRAGTRQDAAALARLTGSTTVPIDVWVDEQHEVRQVSLALPAVCRKSGSAHESTTVDFYGYGPQPAVSAPAPAEVTNLTAQVTAQASRSLAQLGCS
jgi:hypothetical protein